jgi:hypothetical protein
MCHKPLTPFDAWFFRQKNYSTDRAFWGFLLAVPSIFYRTALPNTAFGFMQLVIFVNFAKGSFHNKPIYTIGHSNHSINNFLIF